MSLPDETTRYAEGLVERGIGLSMHLGLFEGDGPRSLDEAQARLDARVLDAASLKGATTLLDVACGFGGTMAAARARHPTLTIVGIDAARDRVERARAASWARDDANVRFDVADACALPFADATFDRVVCVEAAFHFPSRMRFLEEAHRVLRPGGRVALTDILGGRMPRDSESSDVRAAARALDAHLGPWKAPFSGTEGLPAMLERAGFAHIASRDLSAETLPSHRHFVGAKGSLGWPPAPGEQVPDIDRGVRALEWLTREGWLRVVLSSAEKP